MNFSNTSYNGAAAEYSSGSIADPGSAGAEHDSDSGSQIQASEVRITDPQGSQIRAGLGASPIKKLPQLVATAARTSLTPDAKTYDNDGKFQFPLWLTVGGKTKVKTFPMKIFEVLSRKEYSDIVCWTEEGEAFVILLPMVFERKILPTFIKGTKYSSFLRKLRRWGFHRRRGDSETCYFFHENFQRSRPDLLYKMTCRKRPWDFHNRFSSKPQPNALMLQAGHMTPSPEMIAQAQAIQRSHQLSLIMQQMQSQQMQAQQMQAQQQMQTSRAFDNMSGLGGLDNDNRLNFELEVARRLQNRVQASSFPHQEELAMMMMQQQNPQNDNGMQTSVSFPEYSSLARRQAEILEETLVARMQQAEALRLAIHRYDGSG